MLESWIKTLPSSKLPALKIQLFSELNARLVMTAYAYAGFVPMVVV